MISGGTILLRGTGWIERELSCDSISSSVTNGVTSRMVLSKPKFYSVVLRADELQSSTGVSVFLLGRGGVSPYAGTRKQIKERRKAAKFYIPHKVAISDL